MVNPKSKKIFEKMLTTKKIEVGGSYQDYLINRGKQYDLKRLGEQEKKLVDDPENKDCTFRPQTYSS